MLQLIHFASSVVVVVWSWSWSRTDRFIYSYGIVRVWVNWASIEILRWHSPSYSSQAIILLLLNQLDRKRWFSGKKIVKYFAVTMSVIMWLFKTNCDATQDSTSRVLVCFYRLPVAGARCAYDLCIGARYSEVWRGGEKRRLAQLKSCSGNLRWTVNYSFWFSIIPMKCAPSAYVWLNLIP